MRKHSLLAAAMLFVSCVRPDEMYPIRDAKGDPIRFDRNDCLASVAARRYIHRMRSRVYERWHPPPQRSGVLTVVLTIGLDESGKLEYVYAETPDDPLHASAVAAFERAGPFGPVPDEAICLAEEQFQAKFTIEVR